jgi:hypothetical protein
MRFTYETKRVGFPELNKLTVVSPDGRKAFYVPKDAVERVLKSPGDFYTILKDAFVHNRAGLISVPKQVLRSRVMKNAHGGLPPTDRRQIKD